jgi:hypothetical protein
MISVLRTVYNISGMTTLLSEHERVQALSVANSKQGSSTA